MACGKFGCQMSTAGMCADPYCPRNGLPLPGSYWPMQPMQPMFMPPTPMGCICPPTSEQTCKGALCPRRGSGSAFGDVRSLPDGPAGMGD